MAILPKKKKQHSGKFHTLKFEKLFRNESHQSLIGRPGFSRVVFCNDPKCPDAQKLKYCGNYVRTTKYTLASFLPKSLFEQFRRVANLYFLLSALLSLTPISPVSAISNVLPLVVVVGAAMVKELVEDCRRKRQVIIFHHVCKPNLVIFFLVSLHYFSLS